MINQILRQTREDSFYVYRHAIVDIVRCLWRPLPAEEDSVSLTLYRGQLMTVLEVEKLKSNVWELVVFSSFMPTTFNRSIAEVFAGNGLNVTPNLVSVFLKIYLDTSQSMRPYALVPNSAEEEVLFSPGTKFLLMSCRKLHDNGRHWLFELEAISEEQQEQLTLTYGETLMLLTSANGWPTSSWLFLSKSPDETREQGRKQCRTLYWNIPVNLRLFFPIIWIQASNESRAKRKCLER